MLQINWLNIIWNKKDISNYIKYKAIYAEQYPKEYLKLGSFCSENGLYEQMENYYLLGFKHGDKECIIKLINYYINYHGENETIKYRLIYAKKDPIQYSLVAAIYAKLNDFEPMEHNLLLALKHKVTYYEELLRALQMNKQYNKLIEICDKYKIFSVIKFIAEAFNSKDFTPDELTLEILTKLNSDELPSSLKLLQKFIKSKLDLIHVHLMYSENGIGYNEAKSHFLQNVDKILSETTDIELQNIKD